MGNIFKSFDSHKNKIDKEEKKKKHVENERHEIAFRERKFYNYSWIEKD